MKRTTKKVEKATNYSLKLIAIIGVITASIFFGVSQTTIAAPAKQKILPSLNNNNTIYLFDRRCISDDNYQDAILLSAMQGLLAKDPANPQIYITDSIFYSNDRKKEGYDDNSLLRYLKNTNLSFDESFYDSSQANEAQNLKGLFNAVKDYLPSKYITYDYNANNDSANVATTLAGKLDVLPLDTSTSLTTQKDIANELSLFSDKYLENGDCSSLNYENLLDNYFLDKDKSGTYPVTPKNSIYAFELNPYELNANIDTNNPYRKFVGSRDFVVKTSGFCFFGEEARQKIMDSGLVINDPDNFNPQTIYGWSVRSDGGTEEAGVSNTSSNNFNYVAADGAHNLSFWSLYNKNITIKEANTETSTTMAYDPTKTYVCFIVSDGDNLGWIMNMGNSSKWWGSSSRGLVPIGWTMPPSLINFAPNIWNWYIEGDNQDYVDGLNGRAAIQTKNDEFIVGPSGLGFTFGKVIATDALNTFMKKTNMHVVTLFGTNNPEDNDYTSLFKAENENIKGAFYFGFWPPDNYKGHIIWNNDKPIFSASQYLNGNPTDIATSINKEKGFQLVYSNAWAVNRNIIDDINTVTSNLDSSSTVVVTPSQFIDLLKQSHIQK
ncbi:MAG: hypothetical protein GY756_22970 [bacterium]|nr:hypothetical protein [bacterium]